MRMRRASLAVVVVAACASPGPPPHQQLASLQMPAADVAPAHRPLVDDARPPVARTVAIVDRAFGLDVADPYRWMEGDDNEELDAYLRAQGRYAAHALAAIPGRDEMAARIRELGHSVTSVWGVQVAGGTMIHSLLAAGEQLRKLVVREADGRTRVLIDPARLDGARGQHAALHAYAISPDGKLVAYVIAHGGNEIGAIHFMEIATGKPLPDVIERIWGEGAGCWLPDGKGLLYTQLAPPQAGLDPMLNTVARLHRLGDPVGKDVTLVGREPGGSFVLLPEEVIELWMLPSVPWVIALAGRAQSEQRIAIARLADLDLTGAGRTPWRAVSEYADGVESAIPHGDRLYLKTFKGAPNRKLVSVPLARPDLANAHIEIAERPDAQLVGLAAARDALYLRHNEMGRARMSRWPWRGRPAPIALPHEGWAHDLATDPLRDGITFQLETWTSPGVYYAYDVKAKKLRPAGLASIAKDDFSAMVATEVEATSADGTRVPLSILHLKGAARDGSHPTTLFAYGAYGFSITPGLVAARLAWLELGGVFAIAHVRGGGEKGRRWQDDGSREKKMNGVRDLIACAEYLIAEKYTTRDKLGLTGGSMGGLLVARTLTERPDLVAAVNVDVGFVNPLRMLNATNGADQKPEIGDPATEAGYRSILEMDPYLHVKPGTPYPAVIFTVGLNDRRVAPWMTGKMAARLLAATTSKRPILVRVDTDAGHGAGSTRDQLFNEIADVASFFLSVFGVR
jgi:prolyl oligopeptidase